MQFGELDFKTEGKDMRRNMMNSITVKGQKFYMMIHSAIWLQGICKWSLTFGGFVR